MDRARLLQLARERFGIRRFRPGQLELMEAVLRGEDALGLLPTGAGKSLTYQLPALVLSRPVLVVSPLISLMQDQHDKLQERDIDAAKLNSTLAASDEREVVEEIRDNGYELIYVTPERLEKPECLDLLRKQRISLVVVDEAHCVSQWGHDFRPAYLSLRSTARELGNPPVLALTATATPETIADILKQLDIEGARVVQTGVTRDNLFFRVERTPREEQKDELLSKLLAEQEGVGIIYVSTVRTAVALHEKLLEQAVAAGLYHGKLKKGEREETQRRFMADQLKVMVATNAFGLGIDKPDLRFVVHYNFPDSLESYYQEAGRAGRDGKPAQVVLLYRLEDKRLHTYFLAGKYPKREESRRMVEALGAHLKQAPGKAMSLRQLALLSDVAEKHAKVVVAQLEGAQVVESKQGRVRLLRPLTDLNELDALLDAYEARRTDDRERLQAMMHYAQSTACRMGMIAEYFGQAWEGACGHCDNCQHAQAAEAHHTPDSKRTASAASPRTDDEQALQKLVGSAVGNVDVEQVVR